jgi:hypothetical protein
MWHILTFCVPFGGNYIFVVFNCGIVETGCQVTGWAVCCPVLTELAVYEVCKGLTTWRWSHAVW